MNMQNVRVIWSIVLLLGFSNASGQEWRTLYGTALKSYEANDLGTSYADASKALEYYLKESGEQSENYAALLRLLENICYADNKFAEGLEFASKEVTLRARSKDAAYAAAVSQQGMFYQALGDYHRADTSFRDTYQVLSQLLPPGDLQVVEAKLMIGVNCYLKEDFSQAWKFFTETLNTSYEEVSPVFIQAYYFFGQLLQESRDFRRALDNFQLVQPYYETIGPSADYARLLTNTGLCYHGLQQWERAETAYGNATAMLESLNEKGEDYIRVVNARVANFHRMGQPQKAESLYAAVEANITDAAGAAAFYSNKASISASHGDYANAEKYYRTALSRLDKLNADHQVLFADILYNLAVVLDDASREPESEKLLRESEQMLLSRGASGSQHVTQVRIGLANLLSETGRGADAMKVYTDVLLSASGSSFAQTRAMGGIGLLRYKQGDIRAADSVFRAVIDAYNVPGRTKDDFYPAALNNFAAVKQTQGEYATARKLLKDAAEYIRRTSGVMNVSYARALENLGYIDLDIGALTSAKTEIDSAVVLFEKLLGDQSHAYALSLVSKGKYHQNAGEYTLAEPCFKKAFQLVGTLQASDDSWVKSANALAVYYQTMGNYDQAEPLFRQILARIEKNTGKTSAEYSTTLQNLATLYELQDQMAIAAPLLEEALAIDKKVFGDHHPKYIITLRNLAAAYQKTGKRSDARILLELALDATRGNLGDNHPSYAATLSNLASLYQDMGSMKEAEKAWTESVEIRKRLLGEQHPDYARSLYGLATVFFGQRKLKEANEHYKTVIGQYLYQIGEYFPALSEKEKGAFYQKIKPVFDTYQDFCIQYYRNNPEETEVLRQLYRIQLLTKAILLNSSSKVRQTILSSGDAELVNAFRNWLGIKEQIVHYYALSADERAQYTPVEVLRQKANDLEKHLSVSSALFRSQFGGSEYNSKTISALLQPGEAAIEIMRIQRKFVKDSVYYIALILKHGTDQPALVIWPYGQKLENRFFRFHRNAIKYHMRDTISYNYYWKPLVAPLSGIRKIYLSADGIFNKINFNILQNNDNHHWVLDDYEIHLLSNTREILEHASRKPSPHHQVHLYGYADFHLKFSGIPAASLKAGSMNRNFGFHGEIPMLPGTQVEIGEIGKLFSTQNFNIQSFQVQDASEANIKKTPHVKVLHIATHGFFMNDVEVSDSESEDRTDFFNNPLLRSGILLAGAGVSKSESDLSGEDGILTAYEAMNIDLNETDLVVLSACETALGELKNGEGVYGLQRSFIVAGAEAVIMSLWQVDDVATQELMVSFYDHWLKGQPKHEAFRNAQLMVKQKYPSPFYWGAFILVGE